jgi:hypothetical protein
VEETNKRVIEESDKVPKKYLKGKRLISQPLTFFVFQNEGEEWLRGGACPAADSYRAMVSTGERDILKVAGSDSEGRNKVRMAMEKGDGDGEGGMEGIAEACPPPDTGRGRGPQDTSSAVSGTK